jgi:undecaprenyl-diphosphatase
VIACLAAVGLAAGVAVSLVPRHIHYAPDTAAGYCIALATVLAVALVLDFLGSRLPVKRDC